VGTDVVYLDQQTVVLRAAAVRSGMKTLEIAARGK
jgi:hypothetical protein